MWTETASRHFHGDHKFRFGIRLEFKGSILTHGLDRFKPLNYFTVSLEVS